MCFLKNAGFVSLFLCTPNKNFMMSLRRKSKQNYDNSTNRGIKTIRWSILQNFTLLIVFISLAFCSAFIAVAFMQSSMVFEKIVNKPLDHLENKLHDQFYSVSTTLRVVSRIRNKEVLYTLDTDTLNRMFISILKDYPQIVSVKIISDEQDCYFMLGRKGDHFYNIVYQKGNEENVMRLELDRALNTIRKVKTDRFHDPIKEKWFKEAIQNNTGDIIWSKPYMLSGYHSPGITASIPLKKKGKRNGMMAFDISFELLSKELNQNSKFPYGSSFVMSDKKRMIMFSENSNIKSLHNIRDIILQPIESLQIPHLTNGIQEWQSRKHRKRDKLIFFSSEMSRWMGSIRSFQLDQHNTLLIGFLMPTKNKKYFDQYLHQWVSIPIIFILGFLIALVMANKVSKKYSTPLKELVEQSQRISRMDLKKGQPIQSEIKELQQLADSHEQMRKELEEATDQLRISNEKLEDFSQTLTDKVEERTAELNEKSKELKELNRTLEQKVVEEVEASVKKDQIMLQSARQAQMGEMISMIAHQWRQPLSSISTVTGSMLVFLELDTFETEQFKEMLNAINNHAQYLSSTINDFRNFFKPNKEMQTVDLNEILKQTISIIGKSLEYKSIALQENYDFKNPIHTFPNELTQVFLNIIKNAQDVLLETKVENPQITINGHEEGDLITIEFLDNAGGISEEIMDKIFEPYYSTKNDKTGTGLGLYMSKLIVEKHCKGEIIAKNQGSGACFSIKMCSNSESILNQCRTESG